MGIISRNRFSIVSLIYKKYQKFGLELDLIILWKFLYQEVEAREAEDGKMKSEVDSIDGRLNIAEVLQN